MELLDVMKNLSIEHVGNDHISEHVMKCKTIDINNIHTEVVYADYANKTLLIVSQYQKIGSLFSVTQDEIHSPLGTSNIFTTKVIFGATGEEQEVAARYLAEALNITKPLAIFFNLKSYDKATLDKCKDIVLGFKQEEEQEE